MSEDDENANEDKSDIGYISDVSTEADKAGKGTKTSSKHGKKKTRKRQTTSKSENEPPKKAKKGSQKQV